MVRLPVVQGGDDSPLVFAALVLAPWKFQLARWKKTKFEEQIEPAHRRKIHS